MSSSKATGTPDWSALEFTGERYTPECVREMLYEHYARYAMVSELIRDRHVLDCASGEGYGSALLAQHALSVVGVDVSEAAVAHAKQRYQANNLKFFCDDAMALKLPEQCFDVVLSFETLEHVSAHTLLMQNFKRVLKPSGALVISTPDKYRYSDVAGYQNEFHVKELYRNEFEALLAQHYQHYRIFGQSLLMHSHIWDLQTAPERPLKTQVQRLDQTAAMPKIEAGLAQEPMYLIAVASDQAETVAACADQLHLFADHAQSIYRHYHAEIRNGMEAAHQIKRLEAEIVALRAQIAGG